MEATEVVAARTAPARPGPGGRVNPLSRRREANNRRTIELLSQAKDESLPEAERQRYLNLAVELNLPIAEALARRYRSRGEDLEDLVQVARLGLIQAAVRFSPDTGNFAAFAVPTITGEIKRHFRDHFWTVPRPPRRLQELHHDVAAAWSDLAQEFGRTPTAAEIADRLGADLDQVREAMTTSPFNAASLDAPTQTARPASEWIGSPDPGFEAVEDALEHAQVGERLQSAIADLSDDDRLILQMRFGENCRQSDIAAVLGISQMSVSRRLTRIIRRLQRQLQDAQSGSTQASTQPPQPATQPPQPAPARTGSVGRTAGTAPVTPDVKPDVTPEVGPDVEAGVAVLSGLGRVLADPIRCRLLLALRHGPTTEVDLARRAGVSPRRVSDQLEGLCGCGLVAAVRSGSRPHYRLNPPLAQPLAQLCDAILTAAADQSRTNRAGRTPSTGSGPSREGCGTDHIVPTRPRTQQTATLAGGG